MLLTPKEHAPRARCDSCGSPEVFSVCHHCGKCLCREHSPPAVNAAGRPVSRELHGLGLDGGQAGVYHCAEHHHVVKGGLLVLVLAGVCIAVVGAIVTIADLIAGLTLLLLGAGIAVGSYLAHRRRIAAAQAVMPPLPVVPSLDSVRVLETLRGEVRLGADGKYVSTPPLAEGVVEVVMTLNKPDRERLRTYRGRYGLAEEDPVEFSAGFAVLKGEAGFTFARGHADDPGILPGSTSLCFRGEAHGHPLFRTGRRRSERQWTVRLPYGLQGARAPGSAPIWIVPSLAPGSDKRTLKVDLHWVAPDEERPEEGPGNPTFLGFEVIKLVVPKAWGNVEMVSPPNALISQPETGFTRTIEWRLLPPARQESPKTNTLTIRFEKPVRKQDTLSGHLRGSFQGTHSGVTDVRMYWPTGGSWAEQRKASVTTQAEVDFELSLNSVRYQAVRVVPDGARDIGRPSADTIPGVIPDHRTVIALTNELSSSDYYVKQVTENPPRGGGRAGLVNRLWDIAGRRYEGVFPIDFHITIKGEEEYQRGDFHPNAGNTVARLTVRGSYVNQEMETQVESVWDALHEIVVTGLEEPDEFSA